MVAEQFTLKLDGNFAYFIQEKSTSVGEFETPCTVLYSPREGPFYMSEKFAFEEIP